MGVFVEHQRHPTIEITPTPTLPRSTGRGSKAATSTIECHLPFVARFTKFLEFVASDDIVHLIDLARCFARPAQQAIKEDGLGSHRDDWLGRRKC